MAIKGTQPGLKSRGGFNVEIKLDGDWFKLKDLVNNLDLDIMAGAMLAQKAFAEKYVNKLKQNISNGGRRFGYPQHSPLYRRFKARKGGPGKLFYWGGSEMDSIQIVKLPGNRVGVGIPKGLKRDTYFPGDKNQLTISEYANILEHGAYGIGIPKRPIFSDTLKYDMGGISGLQKTIQWHLVRHFNMRGIKLNKL